jgi:hypothetical protein
MFGNIPGLLFNPHSEWKKLSLLSDEKIRRRLLFFPIMALLPPIGFYIGTTQVGWTVMGDNPMKLTEASAIPLAVLFYLALICCVVGIGWAIHWMSRTYRADSFLAKDIVLVGYAATPVFLAGLAALVPNLWVDILLATAACCYMIYHLYVSIPVMLHVPEDRGFLFASAIFLMSLIAAVVVIVATVILWEYVATPEFIA